MAKESAGGDFRYEEALAAALGVLHLLENRPHQSRQERLAQATYLVLDAIYRAEEAWRAETQLPVTPVVRLARHELEVQRRSLPLH